MIYEVRAYGIKKGMRADWIQLMEEMIIPFQKKMGMDIIGCFKSLDDEDTYVWMRRFNDEAELKMLYDRVYGSSYWKTEVRAAMKDMLIREKINVHRLEPVGDIRL